jgi:hypothetical protein
MKKPGFGLTELLVSSSLLLFLIAGTAQLLLMSLAAKRNADFHMAASRCASAKLEYLKSVPFDSPELQAGTNTFSLSDGAFLEPLNANCLIEDLEETVKRVVLEISAQNAPRKKQTFCLLLCRELEF